MIQEVKSGTNWQYVHAIELSECSVHKRSNAALDRPAFGILKSTAEAFAGSLSEMRKRITCTAIPLEKTMLLSYLFFELFTFCLQTSSKECHTQIVGS